MSSLGRRDCAIRAIGIDACKKGWIGFTSDGRAYFGKTIDELVYVADADGELGVIAIDIPIGLPIDSPRQADVLARRFVGKRASSVFATPIRAALEALSHAEATLISTRVTGKGISRQSYAIREKILEVDEWLRSCGRTVIEVHPEVCFATIAGRTLEHGKATWAGVVERRSLLRGAGIEVPEDLGEAGAYAAVDDVLDAAAAVWTACRYAAREAVSYPSPPDGVGAIWA